MKRVDLMGCGLGFDHSPDFSALHERWALNSLMFMRYSGDFDGWSRWFDLHSTAHIQRQRPKAYDWYRAQTKPIYRWEPDPALPNSVAYPLAAIQAAFPGETDFGCSLSWMLALALLEGFDHIHLFWFQMMHEYTIIQVPSVRYWIGRARGMGVSVEIHGDSDLKPAGPLYGLHTMELV